MTTRKYGGRKNNKTVKKQNKCCEATYHSLHHWFKHMYEHLGWMVLAKSHGHMDKVIAYKSALMRLKMAMEERMKYMKDKDRKMDLGILHRDLLVLIDHAHKDL